MKPKILLVEDDANLVELLRYNLESAGFDVVQTGDGEEALMLADEEKPDLVILDWMIANLSGIEVCRRLRRAPEMPVLAERDQVAHRGEQVHACRRPVVLRCWC